MDYCARTHGCAYWQLVTGTSKCYLKGNSANYTANGGSVAGPARCQQVSGVTGWASQEAFLFLNGSPHVVTCLNLSSLTNSSSLTADALTVTTQADLARHGVQEQELTRPPIVQPASCVELGAWSMTRFS